MTNSNVKVGPHLIGADQPLVFIAGPCVIEGRDVVRRIAGRLISIMNECHAPLIFKASYDKANRSSITSFRGPGLVPGLEILRHIREEFGIPVTSDIHDLSQVEPAAEALDLVQIPAFLCRQTDLVVEAARQARAINIKKGQFVSPEAMGEIIAKATSTGQRRLLVTERGSFFGYGDLVVDMRSFPRMKKHGFPVVFDATHSVQKPAALGSRSGGERYLAPTLAAAAVAAGCDAVFMEVHEDPDSALSDGPNMLPLEWLPHLISRLQALRSVLLSSRQPAESHASFDPTLDEPSGHEEG
ncbi:MAG: 3-deoxy-8-phosphooctulonate synthase [Planctomycetota bacterium]